MNEEKSISSNDGMCHGAGLLSGCSSEPKNPGDSNEPVTTAAAGTSGESQAER